MKETRSHCFIVNIRAHTVAIVWYTQSIWRLKHIFSHVCTRVLVYVCKDVKLMLCYKRLRHTSFVSLFHTSSTALDLPLISCVVFLSVQLKISAYCCCCCFLSFLVHFKPKRVETLVNTHIHIHNQIKLQSTWFFFKFHSCVYIYNKPNV